MNVSIVEERWSSRNNLFQDVPTLLRHSTGSVVVHLVEQLKTFQSLRRKRLKSPGRQRLKGPAGDTPSACRASGPITHFGGIPAGDAALQYHIGHQARAITFPPRLHHGEAQPVAVIPPFPLQLHPPTGILLIGDVKPGPLAHDGVTVGVDQLRDVIFCPEPEQERGTLFVWRAVEHDSHASPCRLRNGMSILPLRWRRQIRGMDPGPGLKRQGFQGLACPGDRPLSRGRT